MLEREFCPLRRLASSGAIELGFPVYCLLLVLSLDAPCLAAITKLTR